MTFRRLAEIVGKQQKSVEVFFSRKQLSIHTDTDVKKYIMYCQRGRQWRTSTYSAPHLRKYHYRRLEEMVAPEIGKYFSKAAFWDRPPESFTKRAFIQRVVRDGIFTDVEMLLRKFSKADIRSVYPNPDAMIRDFNRSLIPHKYA